MIDTEASVIALAPDAASAAAGRKLATASSWASLGRDAGALWGECKGSGAKPYQTRVEATGIAFKCSCPSRKFPCKHALGLMLLGTAGSVPEASPPTWVAEWLEKRDAKSVPAKPVVPVDPAASAAASAKRAVVRESRVAAGLDELERWLCDIVRLGLARAASEPARFWEARAARLIDAQAPGAARRVRALASYAASGASGAANERLVDAFGSLFLLREAFARSESLAPELRADVRRHLGWTQPLEEVAATSTDVVSDRWTVVGVRVTEEDRLVVHRVWLYAPQAHRYALILQYDAPGRRSGVPFVAGTALQAKLAYFPSALPSRAVVLERGDVADDAEPPSATRVEAVLNAFARAAGADPWLDAIPVCLAARCIVRDRERWILCDETGAGLPLALGPVDPWIVHAVCGNRPISLAGEWDGSSFLPLAAWHGALYTAFV